MVRALASLVVLGLAGAVAAQQVNPVYFDDAPRARDVLAQAPGLVASGNAAAAVRAIQRLLDEEPDRVLEVELDPDLYVSVRRRVHEALLGDPVLLAAYREMQGPRAEALLEKGETETVERSYLLTPAGFEAALRLAQQHLEMARFDAAWLTLEQLDHHPDRTGGRAVEAAELAATVAKYADSEASRHLASGWADDADLGEPDLARSARPAGADTHEVSPLTPNAAVNTKTLVQSPLHSVRVMPEDVFEEYFGGYPGDTAQRRAQRLSQPWIFPVVVGDTVYMNDGVTISAWDRFTLSPRWRAEAPLPGEGMLLDPTQAELGGFGGGSTTSIEDVNTVTVSGGTVFAVTGIASNDEREGDGRVHAFDAETGAWRWSADVSALDEQLSYTGIRGPLVVDADVVVAAVRKDVQARRLVSTYLVGLDAGDGSLRWVRPLGSAGSLPYRSPNRASPAPALVDGVVYRFDDVGYVCAVEAETGRVRWIRRVPSIAVRSGATTFAWAAPDPVIRGNELYMLNPDGQRVLKLDRRDGALLGERRASLFGSPKYLVGVGEYLFGVGIGTVSVVPFDSFDEGRVRSSSWMRNAQMQGRGFESGGKLVVPLDTGLMIVSPDAPDEPVLLDLDHGGNMVALESQLLVADAEQLHSYLVWDVASGLLRRRMDEHPGEAGPAVTYAELAFLSHHNNEILTGIDRAIEAVDGGDEASRGRLIAALGDMITRSQRHWFDEAASDPSKPDEAPGAEAGAEARIRDASLLGEVVARYGAVARTPDERVFHLLARGRLAEVGRDVPGAIDAYQAVLDEPRLAEAVWSGSGITVRAEREAGRRLARLLELNGPFVYAAHDEQAGLERELLAPDAGGAELERLARRYPVSALTPQLWLDASARYSDDGSAHRATRALRSALTAAEFSRGIGRPVDPALLGELGGRLVTALAGDDRVGEAASVLRDLTGRYADIVLTVDGAALETGGLGELLAERLSRRTRAPNVGAEVRREVQRLEGWRPLIALASETSVPATDRALFVSAERREVALFAGSADAPELRQVWSRGYEGEVPPRLVRLDDDAAYLFEPVGEQGRLVRLDAATGEQQWATPVFDDLFGPDDAARERLHDALGPVEVYTPLDGRVRLIDLLVTLDEQTAVLVERSGRAAAIDLGSGSVLWGDDTPVSVVFDIDARGGVLAIGGAREQRVGAVDRFAYHPAVVSLDVRTGELLQRVDDVGSAVRWVRVGPDTDVVVGMDQRIVCYNVGRGLVNWTSTNEALANSLNAWVFDDRLFVLADSGDLWLGSISTGRAREEPLRTDRRLISRSAVRAGRVGPSVWFGTARGLLIFDSSGDRVGVDALDGFDAFVPPVRGEDYFYTIDTLGEQADDGSATYALYVLDTVSAKQASEPALLLLDATPRDLALLDGRVLVSVGGSTVVLRAPVSP